MTPRRFREKLVEIYRINGASEEDIEGAINFMIGQLGKKYALAGWKNPNPNNTGWYCSELVWAAFYHQGIFLDADDNNAKGSVVMPSEIKDNDQLTLIMHYQYETTSQPISETMHSINCNGEISYDIHTYRPHAGYVDKCYQCDKLSSSETTYIDLGYLNCRSEKVTNTVFCSSGRFLVYEVNIDCAKSYDFDITAFSELSVFLYDENESLITISPVIKNNNCTINFTQFLNKGIYYLRVSLLDIYASSDVIINCKPTWQSNGTEVTIGENNINTHMHISSNCISNNLLYFINNFGAGFYKFSLEATALNGSSITYPTKALEIYDHMDEYQEVKYDVMGYSESSETINGENYLYMYLERNGYYYIHVNLPNVDYSNVKLIIERVSVEEINVANRFDKTFTETIVNYNDMTEYATGFSIDQTAMFDLSAATSETYSGNITLVLFKKEFNSNTNTYFTTDIYGDYLPINNKRLILEEGTYYIGFFENTSNIPVTITINRIVSTSNIMNQVLVMDPNRNLTYGTEVRYNNGVLEGTTITEGFTRHIYFKNITGVPSVSRYDYNFYSSNTSYATVSEYGTVLGKSVSQNQLVTIIAVYKNNPSIIFSIELTILNDTSSDELIIETTQTISLKDFVNGKYKLELNDTNCPYPMIQYYNWSVYVPCQESDITCSMNSWGEITTSGPGRATLTGTYTINPRVTIIINLIITE